MLRNVIAAIRTAITVPVFFLITLMFAAWVFVAAHVRQDGPHIDRTIRVWSRWFLTIAPIRHTIVGRDTLDRNGQYVFVANHLSNFDIPVMFLAAPVPIRYLAKKELYKIPILASAMEAIGIIKIDRKAHGRAHAVINDGVRRAKERGHSLIIFPEGSRSVDGELHEFKKGAFRIAISNDLTVVPVTIDGTWDVWKPGARIFYPGTVTTTIHDPIPTTNLGVEDIDDLRQECHQVIAGALGAPY